jgi:hypothetical protein
MHKGWSWCRAVECDLQGRFSCTCVWRAGGSQIQSIGPVRLRTRAIRGVKLKKKHYSACQAAVQTVSYVTSLRSLCLFSNLCQLLLQKTTHVVQGMPQLCNDNRVSTVSFLQVDKVTLAQLVCGASKGMAGLTRMPSKVGRLSGSGSQHAAMRLHTSCVKTVTSSWGVGLYFCLSTA